MLDNLSSLVCLVLDIELAKELEGENGVDVNHAAGEQKREDQLTAVVCH